PHAPIMPGPRSLSRSRSWKVVRLGLGPFAVTTRCVWVAVRCVQEAVPAVFRAEPHVSALPLEMYGAADAEVERHAADGIDQPLVSVGGLDLVELDIAADALQRAAADGRRVDPRAGDLPAESF